MTRLAISVSNAAKEALTPEFMAKIIADLAAAFIADQNGKITVLSAVKDVDALDKALRASLLDSLKKDLTVLGESGISGGVEVQLGDNDLFFDFSLDALTEIIAAYAGTQISAAFAAEGK
jgi:vacuolar-type H+-ATPase subunit E/Vma4